MRGGWMWRTRAPDRDSPDSERRGIRRPQRARRVRSAERRILRLSVDNDHRRTVGRNGEFELIPDLFSRVGLYRAQPETLGDRHDVESWKVEARNAGRLLQLRERLEDRVFAVAEDHEHDR